MKATKTTRILGFLIDYILWYFLMYFMLLFYFFVIEKQVAFSGNLQGYADIFSNIMRNRSFSFLYCVVLLIYEIGIPLLFGGQTLSKRILKVEITPCSVKGFLIRGLLKLCIVNPCGVISFLLSTVLSISAAMLSDILLVVLAMNAIVVLRQRPAFHDLIAKTTIQKVEGERLHAIYNTKRI